MTTPPKLLSSVPLMTRRHVVTLLSQLALASALSLLGVAEEAKEKPLSAEEVLTKKVIGQATVEILVDKVDTLNIDSVFVPGVSHAQIITATLPKGKAAEEFLVIVSRDVATRLLRSGIVDPADYFRRKKIRVSGMVERIERPLAGKTTYKIHVVKQEQLESVRTP